MTLSGGLLNCSKLHTHKILICNAYSTDLYLSWSIEIYERLRKFPDCSIDFVDLSISSFDSQISFMAKLKRRFSNNSKVSRMHASRNLPTGSNYRTFGLTSTLISYLSSVVELFGSSLKIVSARNVSEFLEISKVDPLALRAAHSTLAGKLGTIEYSPRRRAFQLYLYLLSFYSIKKLVNNLVTTSGYCQVVVGNGRLLNPAAALRGLRSDTNRLITERGARPGMLDTFRVSPHSMSERLLQVEGFWMKSPMSMRNEIAEKYLETRRVMDPISGIKWTENQRSGQIPPIEPAKKICVYYTTTELEFAVFIDENRINEFINQRQAVQALIDCLDPREWTIYIRRHPYSQGTKRDPERKLWQHFANYQNVRIIDPTSNVDSYALGKIADLIAHFNSSIGPELIYQGTCPVITMGDNYWENVDSEYLIRSTDRLKNFLSKPRFVRPKEHAYPWAYYLAKFGESFELVDWINFRAYIKGRHILAKRTRSSEPEL